MSIAEIMAMGPVIPVVIIEDADDAVLLADALLAGGIGVIEITLRSDAAMAAIEAIAQNRPKMMIGAGTVLEPRQVAEVKAAGADFIVSPGAYPELIEAAADVSMPLLPGAATASEMMALMARGLREMKFFPASAAGGPSYLKALASPLAAARFCPTGGISLATASDWLTLPNVVCVGGSWVASAGLLAARDFDAITANAKACAGLVLD